MNKGAPDWARLRLWVSGARIPEHGDILEMSKTGRRYCVMRMHLRRATVMVLPDGCPLVGRTLLTERLPNGHVRCTLPRAW